MVVQQASIAPMPTLTQCQSKNLKFKESYTLWQWTSYDLSCMKVQRDKIQAMQKLWSVQQVLSKIGMLSEH